MNLFKKILLTLTALFSISLLLGYFYFDQKFSPEKNYLQVNNESGKILIKWESEEKKAMLLPIKFDSDSTTYYLQFDTGSPYTIFYKKSISEIQPMLTEKNLAKGRFKIGNCEINSNKFKVIEFGEKPNKNKINIIGTIGTDIIENRKTIINFRENYVILNLTSEPKNFQNKTFDFTFKKRKIIIPTTLNNNKEKFLYDSGTSGYELLTTKEIWKNLKLESSKIKKEKVKSWNNFFTMYTTQTNKTINFKTTKIPLHEITYVEGYSKTQYYLMKLSGMSGMLGNKIFLQKKIYIDAKNMKMLIE